MIAPQPETPEYIATKQQPDSNEGRAELKIFGHTEEFVLMKKMLGRIICYKCHPSKLRKLETCATIARIIIMTNPHLITELSLRHPVNGHSHILHERGYLQQHRAFTLNQWQIGGDTGLWVECSNSVFAGRQIDGYS